MKRIAVFLADGFEEIEAIAPIDILRRAEFDVDVVGLSKQVVGSHQIKVEVDRVLDANFDGAAYDLIVLPGGLPGSHHLRDSEEVIEAIQQANASGKGVAAICAAPLVLDRAGLLEERQYISFPGTEDEIHSGERLADEFVVVDGNIVTACGAGVALDFGYALVDYLGGDADKLKASMQFKQ